MENNKKRHFAFKITAIISSAIALVFLVLSIVSIILIPKVSSISAPNDEPVMSLVCDAEYLYYSTTNSVNKSNKDDSEVIDSYNLIEYVNNQYDLGVSSIKSLFETDTDQLVAISQNANDGYLFLINKDDLSLENYAKFNGEYSKYTTSGNDVVITSKTGKYTLYSRYLLNNFNEVYKTGYYYRITVGKDRNTYTLNRNESITTLNIAIKDNYLYAINSAGISVMDLDFSYNNFHADSIKNIWNNSEFINKYGVKEEPTKDVITLDKDSFKANTSYYDVIGLSISGGFTNSNQKSVYFIGTDNTLNSISFNDIKRKRPEGSINEDKVTSYGNIVFKDLVETDGCVFYDDKAELAYVIFKASNDISRISFEDNMPILDFTIAVEFNIVYMITDHTGDFVGFLFNNSNKSESGVYLAKYFSPTAYLENGWTKSALIYFVIFAIIFIIVAIFAWLGTLKKGYDKVIIKNLKTIFKCRWIYIAMAPSLILLIMFCYYPAIASIGLSFFDYTKENPAFNWNNFENYKFVFTNPNMLAGFKNMFLFLIVDIVTSILPPLIFAFFLSTMKNKKLSKIMRTLLFIPGIIPGIAGNLIWKEAILGNFGVINECIKACGGSVISFLAQSSTAKWSLLLVGFPYVGSYLIFYGGMMNIPSSYYEACELEGVGPWRRFIRIDVPLVFPQLKYVFVCSIINSMQNFARVQSITNGAYDTNVPVLEMYDQIMSGNYGKASAIASIIFVLLFFATYFTMKQKKKEMKV